MEECSNLEISLPEPGEYGVGMIFFPKSLPKKACRNYYQCDRKMGLA
jgi:glutamate synthase (NADPH/NADH) large chain